MKLRLALAFTAAATLASSVAFAGTVAVESHAGRSVRVFVPSKVATNTPLVVMLHGCTQTADDFAVATQMDDIAEKEGFVVAYPEQSADTIATRCYRWYEPAHQSRDAGEPKELADATDEVMKAHGVDPERVYVAGISAGAAMTVILGATYPDRFVAIGVVAGIEYKGATSVSSAFSTSSNGGPSPDTQGDVAHAAMGMYARTVPTFVVHGTSDGVVAKVNGDQVAAQWRRTNTITLGDGAIEPVQSLAGDAGYPFTRMVHRNKANGASVIEHYVVDGLGHAWPGGKDGASYSDPRGPNASALVWAFFKGRTRSAPLDVPAVVLPEGPGAASPDGGTSTGDPSTPPADTSSPAPGEDSGGSGGCSTAHAGRERPHGLAAALLFGLSMVVASRRARGRRNVLASALVALSAGAFALVANGCSDDTTATTPASGDAATTGEGGDDGGAASDAHTASDGASNDASCPTGKAVPDKGETCIGFGKGTPCGAACGLPAFGYVCFNGGPPGFAGCLQAGTTSFGDTYCCPENECVPQPDQDKECKTAGKPHRYQCPPDESGSPVAPPAGCAGTDAGSTALETFYCCP
ncbi:MAG: Poly(3-hydroxybutyrate) depolymerase [Labilithrix sp.]|nr:Poly(3-hydroxybutyrate) depolymerase [Labilithrix sp.]